MDKHKIRHIGWLFGFIWDYICDLVNKSIGTKEIKSENRYDYKPNKPINPALYENITISNLNSNDMDKLEPRLTEEEFKAGKIGYVWLDHTTGKLVFKDDETGNKK